jgi:hypothetical protein
MLFLPVYYLIGLPRLYDTLSSICSFVATGLDTGVFFGAVLLEEFDRSQQSSISSDFPSASTMVSLEFSSSSSVCLLKNYEVFLLKVVCSMI